MKRMFRLVRGDLGSDEFDLGPEGAAVVIRPTNRALILPDLDPEADIPPHAPAAVAVIIGAIAASPELYQEMFERIMIGGEDGALSHAEWLEACAKLEVPDEAAEPCRAELGIDGPDGGVTRYCSLPAGHTGRHQHDWHRFGSYPATLTWEQDERDLDEDYEP
jgi:hypothetical protein